MKDNNKEIALKFIEKYTSNDPFSKYTLYDKKCISLEIPQDKTERMQTIGLSKIKAKSKKFYRQFKKINKKKISKPIIGDVGFALTIELSGVDKNGNSLKIKEICVFIIRNNKIVEENFYYLKSF